jgi:HTH-type transcriptional regulator, sugar sensing transcriptional regulator
MDKTIATLRKLGLNNYESRAYIALMSSGVSAAGKLAEKSGIPRAKIYEVLRNLETRGFAVSNNSRPAKFKAVPWEEAINKMHEKAKKDYESTLGQISDIQKELEESMSELASNDDLDEEMVWVLRGRENIYGTIDKLVDNSEKKIIGATTEEGILRKMFRHKDKLHNAVDRGVEVRLLAPITHLNKDIVGECLGKIVIQHGNSVSARFFLSDDKEGVILLVPDEVDESSETGLYLKSPFFIKGLGHYFEHKWEKTVPFQERLTQLGPEGS